MIEMQILIGLQVLKSKYEEYIIFRPFSEVNPQHFIFTGFFRCSFRGFSGVIIFRGFSEVFQRFISSSVRT